MTAPRAILAVQLAGLGDLLMSAPALQALRAAHPDSRLDLLTWSKHRDAARLLSGVDAVHTLEIGPGGLVANLATLLPLRARYDLAVNLYRVYRHVGALKLALLLGVLAPRRSAGRDGGYGWCFTIRVPEDAATVRHEVERQLALVEHLTGCRGGGRVPLQPRPEDALAAERWAAGAGLRDGERVIVLHAGGARPAHRWPWASFAVVGGNFSLPAGSQD